MEKLKCLLIADFTVETLAGYLNNGTASPGITSIVAPFNQVQQVLLNPHLECWKSKPDFVFVFCQPQRIIESFGKLLNNEAVTLDTVLSEVDVFAEQLKASSERVKFLLVSSFVIDPNRFLGANAFNKITGISYMISQMNLRLSEKLGESKSIYLLDASPWISKAGKNAFQPKLWYLSKTPFHYSVFENAAKEIQSVAKSVLGTSRKLIIMDLDDTLWGGVVGDVDWENIILGGHDSLGEAYVDFQKSLLALSKKGILLAVVSKNDEGIAMTAIEKHPEMVLKKNNFVGWKINWNDKAQNIYDLAKELNLSLDAVVFLDDHPVERARVKEALPEVLVPEMPSDKLLYSSFILGLDCFNSTASSKEDAQRTSYYKTDKDRNENKQSFPSLDQWLATIDISITAEPVSKINIQRAAQLFNKTNQMNLSTRRMSEKELLEFTSINSNSLMAFKVSDKFGDAGLTGVLGIAFHEEKAEITDFLLSCRVMGRKCEETMLSFAIEHAQSKGCKILIAEYMPTAKNKPCLDFFERSGMSKKG